MVQLPTNYFGFDWNNIKEWENNLMKKIIVSTKYFKQLTDKYGAILQVDPFELPNSDYLFESHD